MKSQQGSQIIHNAAWRAFWIKIRELNARQDRPEEAVEQNGAELLGTTGPVVRSITTSNEGGQAELKSL